jgi:hypothetical protein
VTPRLGRQPAFDERSRAFGIAAVEDRAPRSYTWGAGSQLDQGTSSACVGFSWAAELSAKPVVIPTDDDRGFRLYAEAQAVDRAEGRFWPEGASVLAGAKAVQAAGHMAEYRWAFGADELATAASRSGPCVIGIPWHTSMFHPDAQGYVRPNGSVVGGHALLVRGYNVKARRFHLRNSWGSRWGKAGDCYLSHTDMAALLADQGDACVPMRRRR